MESRIAHGRLVEALRHLTDLRNSIGDPYASLLLSVLKPACAYGVRQMTGREPFGGAQDTIVVHPAEVAGYTRLYSPSNCQFTLLKTGKGPFRYATESYLCSDTVPITANDFVFAIPDSYDEYFGLSDDGPARPPKWFKKELWKWYDRKCFLCHYPMKLEDMTIDHIVPKDSEDGQVLSVTLFEQVPVL